MNNLRMSKLTTPDFVSVNTNCQICVTNIISKNVFITHMMALPKLTTTVMVDAQ